MDPSHSANFDSSWTDTDLAGADAPAALKPLGVLVVDDDSVIRTLLDNGLRTYGFDVFTAVHGAEAVHIYERHRAALSVVLMDVQMPVQDGPRTLVDLRLLNPTVRCCFMTGGMAPYTEAELLGLGAAYVLRKPFSSLPEVARLLHQVAGNPSRSPASPPDGAPERRRAARFDGNAITVVLEAAPAADPAEGVVLNRSVYGLGLRIERLAEAGALLVVCAAAAQAQVEVKYCLPQNQHWVMGCQYIGAPPDEVLLLLSSGARSGRGDNHLAD